MAILAVFFFHCAQFFRSGAWILKNAEHSLVADVFSGWLAFWGMPLFFLLSGSGSWYALRSISSGQYLLERAKRLLVPFYTVGVFLLLPISAYFWAIHHLGYPGTSTFWEMLIHYFGHWEFTLESPHGLMPVPFHGHLWFLQYLFLISLLTLPLMHYLRSERGFHLIDTLARWCRRRAGVFLFLIPVLLVRISLKSIPFSGLYTWADFLEFVVFFIIGYILAADTRFAQSIQKHSWICLISGLVSFAVVVYFALEFGYFGGGPFSSTFVLYQTVWSIGRWSWIVFVLNIGAKYLNSDNRVLACSSEAVLPFYILHEPMIVWVGWFVIHWNIGILPKYLIIAVASFVLIMTLYELFVRRFNAVRFFFGMRPRKRRFASPAHPPEGTAA